MSSGASDGTILFRINSDVTKLQRDYQKLIKSNDDLKRKLAEVGSESKKQDKEQSDATEKQITRIGRMVMSYQALRMAIQQVSQAIEEQRQVERRSMETADRLALEKIRFGEMMPRATLAGRLPELLDPIQQMAVERGLDVPAAQAEALRIAQSTSGAFEGRRDLTLTLFRRIAGSRFAGREQELGPTAAGVGDLLKPWLRMNPNATQSQLEQAIDRAASIGITTMSQARLESMEEFPSIAQAAAGVTAQTGGDPFQSMREVGAVFAALTSIGAQPTGEMARTQASNFALGLREGLQNVAGVSRQDLQGMTILPLINAMRGLPAAQQEAIVQDFKGKSFMKQLVSSTGRPDAPQFFMEEVMAALPNIRGDVNAQELDRMITSMDPDIERFVAGRRSLARQQQRQRESGQPSIATLRERLFDPVEGALTVGRALEARFIPNIGRARLAFEAGIDRGDIMGAFNAALQAEEERRRLGAFIVGRLTPGGRGPEIFEDLQNIRRDNKDLLETLIRNQEEENANVQSAAQTSGAMNQRPDR